MKPTPDELAALTAPLECCGDYVPSEVFTNHSDWIWGFCTGLVAGMILLATAFDVWLYIQ